MSLPSSLPVHMNAVPTPARVRPVVLDSPHSSHRVCPLAVRSSLSSPSMFASVLPPSPLGEKKTPWHAVMAHVQTLWERRPHMSGGLRLGSNKGDVTKAPLLPLPATKKAFEQHSVESTERYMNARLAGRHDEVLSMVADDVVLDSSRDGHVEGKPEFRSYLRRVKPSGVWSKARWNDALGVAQIEGNVRILMVNVGVMARFSFDRRTGKIRTIKLGTKSKMQL